MSWLRRKLGAARALWSRRIATRAAPGLALLPRGPIDVRALPGRGRTPDPLTPAYGDTVADIALQGAGRWPRLRAVLLVGARPEAQRALYARAQAAVQRLIEAKARH